MLKIKYIDHKVLASLMVFTLAVVTVLLLEPQNSGVAKIQTFPATVCPAKLSDGASTSVLPSSKILVRTIPATKNKLVTAKTSFYLSNLPLLVDGNSATSINVTRTKARSLATSICEISGSEQWFVGGSGAVSSSASIVLTNSGLSTSIVDLTVYTSTTVSSVISKRISANSSKRIYLDTLAPGEESVVIHAVTRFGRVTTFLYDQRQSGLRSLGTDFVSSMSAPSNRLVIPAISNVTKLSSNSRQTLRILAPGRVTANVRAQIISLDGSFAPIDLDDINIKSKKVVDLKFKPLVKSNNFSLLLKSDQPIVAAVKSTGAFNGITDFAWSTPAPELSKILLYLGGLQPEALFIGRNFEVEISWMQKNRKIYRKTLSANEQGIWRPKQGVLWASFDPMDAGINGGIIFKEQSALSYLPLVAGSQLESAAVPNLDARIINRG